MSAISAAGGGTLTFPPGTYLTGPFNLTSGTTLLLQNSTITAEPYSAAWPLIDYLPSYGQGRDFPGPRAAPLIGAFNASQLIITVAP